MAKSISERIKDWRKKAAANGGKSITVMLDPESVQRLEEMKRLYQESNKTLIARALKCLAESFACKRTEDSKSVLAVKYHQPANDSDGDHLFHPCLKNIKEEIDGGADTLSRKEELKKAIKVMKSEGFESSKIADHLQAANIPTIKGHPRWDGGTIRKWWR